jgi:probable HAF family extracellular repeat protein
MTIHGGKTRSHRRAITLCLLGSTFALASVTGHTQAAHLIDLGVHTGYAINNAGQVALDGAIFLNGVFTPLPPIPGGTEPINAHAINASGSVVGDGSSTNYLCSAVIYINGAFAYFGEPFGDKLVDCATATGINAIGQVVGVATTNHGQHQDGFLYEQGQFTRLSGFPGTSPVTESMVGTQAFGINDSGQITGQTPFDNGLLSGEHAFIYDGVNWTDLGPGTGYAINVHGAVTGVAGPQDVSLTIDLPPPPPMPPGHAFLNSAGHLTDVGVLAGGTQGIGHALNIGGQVVGASDFAGGTRTHAFFYNGVITDLNALVSADDPLKPFVTLTDASGINDGRLIVLNGTDSRDGSKHAYLLQGPWIDVAPGPLVFAMQNVGSVGPRQTVTITNSGTGIVSLGAVSISPNFNASNLCGTILAAATNCSVQVALAPTVSGNLTGALTVIADGLSYAVPLSGDAPITATLAASATTAETGKPITLTWTLSGGTTCSDWAGNTVTASGQATVTQSTAGSQGYQLDCMAGSETANPYVEVTYTWPPVTVSISAAPAAITAGQSTQLTWTSANATDCTASGGGANDDWPGSKGVTGSEAVTEPDALAVSAIDLTFTLSCTSTVSRLTTQASAKVKVSRPPDSSGGGGLDGLSLLALCSVLVANTWRLLSRLRAHHENLTSSGCAVEGRTAGVA